MLAGLVAGAVCATTTTTPIADEDLTVITQTATAAATATGSPGVVETATATASPGVVETATATATPAGPPALTIDSAKKYFATISTTKGDIRIELNAALAPQTVNSFVSLARQGYFNGTTFHRVIPGFVAQGGDPTGTGTGGPGYTIPDEPNDLRHEAGVIAMAKEFDPQRQAPIPNSAGSQFYITLSPQPQLDGQYTVFGRVVSGLEVAASLTSRNPAEGENLPPGDTIISVTIEEQ